MGKFKYTPTKLMPEGTYYDKAAADHAVAFFESLCHTKGDFYRQPFKLLPWEEQLVRDVYGIYKEDGTRNFTTVAVFIPKKNGKTEISSALGLYMLTAGGQQRGEIYACAATREQASLSFDVACDMVRLNKTLSKYCEIRPSRKTIIYKPTRSIFRALSSDAGAASGVNVSCLLFDELWVQKDRKFFDMMTKGTSDSRKDFIHFIISTAGDNTNTICYEVYQKAKDILSGKKVDPTFYPVIFEAERDEDWSDPKVWAKANPSLGVTIDIEKVKAAYESARQNPSEEASFRQLRLNQWTTAIKRWMPSDAWAKCAFPVDPEELKGRVCYGGLDLSSTTDLSAFVLVFPPEDEDDKYQILPFCWVPEDTMRQRIKRDHVPYDIWAKQGYLKTTPGNVVDYGYIEHEIEQLSLVYNIKCIAFDRWGAYEMSQKLDEMGLNVVPFGQGFVSMAQPTRDLMRFTLEQKIAHGGHPVLKWCVENVVVRRDPAENEKPDKAKSNERIDLAVALIMALDMATRNGNNPGSSIYDDRGLLSF